MKHFFLPILLLSLLGGCGFAVTRPKLEIQIAAAAFLAAKDVQAQKYGPNLYRKAEFYYLKAKSAYKRKYFNQALKYAKLSQKFSEKAELIASVKRAEESVQ